MADRFAPPSANPADIFSFTGMIRLTQRKALQKTDDMLPAVIVAYNRTTNRAQVRPLIAVVTTDNRRIERATVAEVPVYQEGGGGFVKSFPFKSGDLGWIKANDRDISLFLQGLTLSPPNTQRMHSFEDAMFFPDTMFKDVVIDPEDVDNLVIQNLSGTVKISWWSNLLKIIAPRVGIGGTPNANAIFDVQSTTKASMPWPRMTTAQRNAIPSPAEGMAVWNTDTHGLNVYNGTTWG